MSLSGLHPSAKGKHKSAQQNHAACSAEPSTLPGNDFVELVWENGQVAMQGEHSRARKNINNNIGLEDLPQISRLRDKALSKGDNSELGRLGMMDSTLNNFHIPVPSELDEHDDIVPWLSHHMDEPVHHNYSSNFITELSGATVTDLLNHTTNINPAERRSHGVRANKNSHPTSQQNPVGCEQLNLLPTRPKMSQLDQLSSLQSQCSFPFFRLKVSDTSSTCLNNTTENLLFADSAQKRFLPNVYPSMKMQTQDHGQRLSSSSIMNFSHFSKHAAVVKSSFDPISAKAGPDKSIPKQMDGKDKWSVLTGVKPSDPSQVAPASGQQSDIGIHSQPPVLSTVDEIKLSKPQAMLLSANHSGHVGCQDSGNIDVYPKQALVPKGNMAVENVEKTAEPVAASSVCSGSSVDRASNDPTYGLKRKYHESEDLEYPSDDVEEESVGMKKTANNRVGSGSKRSRAAEVHNLSERRRRDRINEKMRALQELIPSCNKVDKASMLDEAIEYLKTLQLQVQMMSLGSGLCMPPMMLPHAAHMPRFSPMSAGMGMGMGYGLGMFDMIGNPSSCHLVQMPSVPGTPFQMAPAPMFGFQGQGVSMPMSCAPVSSYSVGLPSRPGMDLNTSSSPLPFGNLVSGQTSQKDTNQARSNDVPLLKDDKSSPNIQDD